MGIRVTKLFAYPANNDSTLVQLYLEERWVEPPALDRLYRTDSSRNSAQGGSGIGLSIVRKIVEDHGGRVWASSREGEGTTMFFVLRKYQEAQVK